MKKGYTLTEVLIAMGIIGVIAAIGAPMFNKARPDQTKIMFLKAYDTLSEVVSETVNSADLYPQIYSMDLNEEEDGRMYDVSKYPLLNYGLPHNPQLSFTKYTGKNKFCNIIADSMNSNPVKACGSGSASSDFSSSYNFTTNPAGMQWKIDAPESDLSNGQTTSGTINYANLVTVDVNGDKSPNSTTGTIKNPPDRYVFYVFADGSIEPASRFAQAFIANRLSLQKHKINLTNPLTGTEFTDRALTAENFPQYSLSVGNTGSSDIRVLK